MSVGRRYLGLVVSVVLLGGCSTTSTRPQTGAEVPSLPAASTATRASSTESQPPDPLGELSRLFVETYQRERTDLKAKLSPVIVVSGSSLILYQGGAKDSARVIPQIYHSLKSIAHLPFAIYLEIRPFADRSGELPDDAIQRLASIRDAIGEAEKALARAGFSAGQLARQRKMLEASDKLLDEAVRGKLTSRARLADYAKFMGGDMLANANEAACSQIFATHRQVMEWKETMSCEEWGRLRVMNRGRHQARYRNSATQYFAWLLNEEGSDWSYPGESMRVIYSEFLGKEEESRDLLATVLIDADASQAFFGDAWRLSEDILSGAESCVGRLPESDRTCVERAR